MSYLNFKVNLLIQVQIKQQPPNSHLHFLQLILRHQTLSANIKTLSGYYAKIQTLLVRRKLVEGETFKL